MHEHGSGGAFPTGDADQARAEVDLPRRHDTTTSIASLVTASPADLLRIVGVTAELTDEGLIMACLRSRRVRWGWCCDCVPRFYAAAFSTLLASRVALRRCERVADHHGRPPSESTKSRAWSISQVFDRRFIRS